jgi:hypothetical protein
MNGESAMSRLIVDKSLVIEQVAILAYWFLYTESEVIKEVKSDKEQNNENVQIYQSFFVMFKEEIKLKN